MHSCIYEGIVTHCRFSPVIHKFGYRLYMAYLDLDEWEQSAPLRKLISRRTLSRGSFLRRDHLTPGEDSLQDSVRNLVEARTGRRPTGPIRVLTQLRYFGYYFSPLNLFYCYDESGTQVEAMVAEVTNTPWKERHCYVLWDGNCTDGETRTQYSHPKAFHVSPFMDMGMDYRWSLSPPEAELQVRLENFVGSQRLFSAGLTLHRMPLTRWNLNKMLLRHPWMTAHIVAAIHWQALRLWWKKCPFYTHPRKRSSLSPTAM